MKIFFPIGSFYPSQVGGPCNTVYWHTCALNDKGIKVKIVTTDNGIKEGVIIKDSEINNESGNVIYLRNKKIPIVAFRKISEGIKWADIIHLNSIFNIFSIYSFIFTKLFYPKKHIILSVRGELNTHALSFSSWKKKIVLPLYERFHKNIVFHGTSDQEIADIRDKFPASKIIHFPNYLQPMSRVVATTKKQLLFMGRIHPIKAIHKLIEAVSLSEVFLNKHFKLIISGDVNERQIQYKADLKDLVSKLKLTNIIEFKGHVTGAEKEILYAESFALVLPSETENFGNVVVESLNQGTPVIASLGTPWKSLEKYKCGIHVSNDPPSLAKSIDLLLSLPKEEYLDWRNNANKLVDQKYNIKTQINNWIDIYNKYS
jgi:glycosyltransferase involved in cell wall biosynthesis